MKFNKLEYCLISIIALLLFFLFVSIYINGRLISEGIDTSYMFEHAINVESTLEEIDVKTSDGKFLHHNDIAILDSNFRQLEQWADGKIWNTILDTKLGQLMLQRYKRLKWKYKSVRQQFDDSVQQMPTD